MALADYGFKICETELRNCNEICIIVMRKCILSSLNTTFNQLCQRAILMALPSEILVICIFRKEFENDLRIKSEAAFKHCWIESNLNSDAIPLAALNVVLIQSLSSTEEFLQKALEETEDLNEYYKTFHVYIMCIVEISCWLLNPDNWKYVRTFTSNCYEDFINTKRKIFKQYLLKEMKGI